MKNFIAQIIALIAVGLIIKTYYLDKKGKILIYQIIASILYGIQYILLGSIVGFVSSLISITRGITYYVYDRKNKEKSISVLLVFIIISIIAGIFSYKNLYSTLPIIGVILYAYALWQEDIKIYREIAFIDAIIMTIYNIVVGAYVSAIFGICEAIFAIVSLKRIKLEMVDNNS